MRREFRNGMEVIVIRGSHAVFAPFGERSEPRLTAERSMIIWRKRATSSTGTMETIHQFTHQRP